MGGSKRAQLLMNSAAAANAEREKVVKAAAAKKKKKKSTTMTAMEVEEASDLKKPSIPDDTAGIKRRGFVALSAADAGCTSEAARALLRGLDATGSKVEEEEEEGPWGAEEAETEKFKRRRVAAPGCFYGADAKLEGTRMAAAGGYEGADASTLLAPRLADRLRPHQLRGIEWILRRFDVERGCLLADEMGLGKTATALGVISVLMGVEGCASRASARSGRCVVACPAGLVPVWLAEVAKWLIPTARSAAQKQQGEHHLRCFAAVGKAGLENKHRRRENKLRASARARAGGNQDDIVEEGATMDLVTRFEKCPLEHKPILIISYEAYRDCAQRLNALRDVALIICDEAHRLKAKQAQIAGAIADSRARRRLLLTATPLQNSLVELHHLLALCTSDKEEHESSEEELRGLLKRFTLRRGLADCDALRNSLPPKTEALVVCAPTPYQRLQAREEAAEVQTKKNEAWALRRIQKARLLCSSPKGEGDLEDCGKWLAIAGVLRAIHALGERAVVVSQYSKVLEAGVALCKRMKWEHCRLDGAATPDQRAEMVSNLNDEAMVEKRPFLMLLSLKAGGVGLTLTGASRLFLFEPSWNPAEDDQAVARIWRQGQTRPVFVYRLATAHSIEERVLHRQVAKAKLASNVRDCQLLTLQQQCSGEEEGELPLELASACSSKKKQEEEEGGGEDSLVALVALGSDAAAASPSELYARALAERGGDCDAADRDGWPAFDSVKSLSHDETLSAAPENSITYLRLLLHEQHHQRQPNVTEEEDAAAITTTTTALLEEKKKNDGDLPEDHETAANDDDDAPMVVARSS